MIQGKCMQVLLDKMDNDPDWDNTSESYNPLALLKLTEEKNIGSDLRSIFMYNSVQSRV